MITEIKCVLTKPVSALKQLRDKLNQVIRKVNDIDANGTAGGSSGSGVGMLTVNVDASVSEDGSTWVLTSHSHSAQEIIEAVDAGMNAQAIVSSEDMGDIRMWVPLTAVVYYGETAADNIIFANSYCGITITFSEDKETWDLQMQI